MKLTIEDSRESDNGCEDFVEIGKLDLTMVSRGFLFIIQFREGEAFQRVFFPQKTFKKKKITGLTP